MPAHVTYKDELLQRRTLSQRSIVSAFVFAAFLMTLLQYWLSAANLNAVPVILLLVAGAMALVDQNRRAILSNLLGGGALLLLFSMLSEVVSLYTGNQYAILYGLTFLLLMVAARLIILQIGFVSIFRCYIYSGICSIAAILITGRRDLVAYNAEASRFTGGVGVHPNLLAFTLASFFFPLFALALDFKSHIKAMMTFALVAITAGLMFVSGSRGALAAVILAMLIMLLRFSVVAPLIHKIKFSKGQILLALFAVAALIFYFSHGQQFQHLVKFITRALQLDSQNRGVHSGFSGRTKFWSSALHSLGGPQWIFGFGFRTALLIDSGYLTVLYENGFALGLVVLFHLLRPVYWLWSDTNTIVSPGWWRYRVALLCLLIVFLLECFVERYLFSYGNQFSMLVVFIMMCDKKELLGIQIPFVRSASVPSLAIDLPAASLETP